MTRSLLYANRLDLERCHVVVDFVCVCFFDIELFFFNVFDVVMQSLMLKG